MLLTLAGKTDTSNGEGARGEQGRDAHEHQSLEGRHVGGGTGWSWVLGKKKSTVRYIKKVVEGEDGNGEERADALVGIILTAMKEGQGTAW